jgi:hypothetical protein
MKKVIGCSLVVILGCSTVSFAPEETNESSSSTENISSSSSSSSNCIKYVLNSNDSKCYLMETPTRVSSKDVCVYDAPHNLDNGCGVVLYCPCSSSSAATEESSSSLNSSSAASSSLHSSSFTSAFVSSSISSVAINNSTSSFVSSSRFYISSSAASSRIAHIDYCNDSKAFNLLEQAKSVGLFPITVPAGTSVGVDCKRNPPDVSCMYAITTTYEISPYVSGETSIERITTVVCTNCGNNKTSFLITCNDLIDLINNI